MFFEIACGIAIIGFSIAFFIIAIKAIFFLDEQVVCVWNWINARGYTSRNIHANDPSSFQEPY